uniref:Uncharacterized protein n=1 Tax=Clastoptera arizonana TaxID=38151 RepID=A0A1B6D0K7_9HEMI
MDEKIDAISSLESQHLNFVKQLKLTKVQREELLITRVETNSNKQTQFTNHYVEPTFLIENMKQEMVEGDDAIVFWSKELLNEDKTIKLLPSTNEDYKEEEEKYLILENKFRITSEMGE